MSSVRVSSGSMSSIFQRLLARTDPTSEWRTLISFLLFRSRTAHRFCHQSPASTSVMQSRTNLDVLARGIELKTRLQLTAISGGHLSVLSSPFRVAVDLLLIRVKAAYIIAASAHQPVR